MNDNDRALCATLASLLQAEAALALPGILCSALALGLLAWPPAASPGWLRSAATLVLLLGLVERVLALRVRLDAGLFERLARSDELALAAMDAALATLRLRRAVGMPRSVLERAHGARRLALRHAFVVVVQCAGAALLLAGLAAAR